MHWEKMHKDALKGHFTNRQERKEVPWPDIPADFEDWAQRGGHRSKCRGKVCRFWIFVSANVWNTSDIFTFITCFFFIGRCHCWFVVGV